MTILSDDVADLRSGKLSLEQLTNKWLARTWTPIPSGKTAVEVNDKEADQGMGGEGTWDEVLKMRLTGKLSPDEFSHISKTIDNVRGRKFPPYVEMFQQVANTAAKVASSQQAMHARHLAMARKQTVSSDTIGHRQPTAVEAAAKTDFKTIQLNWKAETKLLLTKWDAVKAAQIDELRQKIQDAADSGDVDALAGIMADTTGSDVLAHHMKMMMEQSVTTAKAEALAQGVTMPTLSTTGLSAQLDEQANAIADLMNRSLSNSAATQALMRYGVKNMSGADVGDAVKLHLEELSGAYLDDILGGALTQAQNGGRLLVMNQAAGRYYASELLDENTCKFCAAVDGTDYSSLDDAESDYPQGGYSECLGGPRCRGTIVAVYDEAHTDRGDDSSDADPSDEESADDTPSDSTN